MNLKNNVEKQTMDAADLWREEVFTDRKVGVIRRLTPVKPDGSSDSSRKTVYLGEASLMTAAGSLPLSFEIAAGTLDEAVAAYSGAAQRAFAEAINELDELRRRAATQIVIPQGGAAGLSGSGLPPGVGKLKL